MKHISILSILLFISSFTYASELEFALSDDSIETSYQSLYAGNFGTTISWLHADVDEDYAADDLKSDTAGIGLYAHGKTGNIRTHLGGKAFWLHTKSNTQKDNKNDMHGIALGGAIDAYIIPKLFIKANALYAPDILTGGDFENYIELGARVAYQVLPNAAVFVGYRFIEAEIDDKDLEIYQGGFIGFNFRI